MDNMQALKNVTIYTDGACIPNPGKGGYGIVMLYNGHRKEVKGGEPHTTNNRMELSAVIKALELLKERCNVELYSDSKYVVDAVTKGWLKNWKRKNWKDKDGMRLNYDLWQKLDAILNEQNVTFIWVKGHADNVENERCDFLANEFIEQS